MNGSRDYLQEINRCLYCDQSFSSEVSWTWFFGLTTESMLCPSCEGSLERIVEIGCEMCGRPVVDEEDTRLAGFVDASVKRPTKFVENPLLLCRDCLGWKGREPWGEHDLQHRALYVYNDFLKELMARFKYRGDAELGMIFRERLVGLVKGLGVDVVTVVPLVEGRLWERGFNQGLVLARGFVMEEVLVRRGALGKQSKRGRVGRMEGLSGVFCLSECGLGIDWCGKRVLVIDDIYTTGATLRSVGEVFYRAGAERVFAVTVARASGV